MGIFFNKKNDVNLNLNAKVVSFDIKSPTKRKGFLSIISFDDGYIYKSDDCHSDYHLFFTAYTLTPLKKQQILDIAIQTHTIEYLKQNSINGVFICPKCGEVFFGNDPSAKCPRCGDLATLSNYSIEKWNSLSNEEREAVINECKITSETKYVKLYICSRCGTAYSSDGVEKLCKCGGYLVPAPFSVREWREKSDEEKADFKELCIIDYNMYYCNNCGNIRKDFKDDKHTCDKCKGKMVKIPVTLYTWNRSSQEQKTHFIEKLKSSL